MNQTGFQDVHTLPSFFVERMEELYIYWSELNQGVWGGVTPHDRDVLFGKYFDRVEYVVSRILPKLSGEDELAALEIVKFVERYRLVYGDRPEDALHLLADNNRRLTKLINKYGFDTILLRNCPS